MTAPLKTIEGTSNRRRHARDRAAGARGRARAGARADGAEGRGARRHGGGDPRAQGRRSSPPMPRTSPRPKRRGATAAFLDRLALDDKRVAAMADGVDVVRGLADPVGTVTERWTRPNGMTIERVRVPLGVVGIIYESRPERHRRCRRALPQGRQCRDPARRLGEPSLQRARSMRRSSRACAPPACRRPRSSWCRRATAPRSGMMLAGLDGAIDVIVPRGGKSLVARVQAEARVPVFAHLEGICHVYVDKAADARHGEGDRAQRQDAPHRRLRRRRDAAGRSRRARRRISSRWSTMLLDAGCEVRGDRRDARGRSRA